MDKYEYKLKLEQIKNLVEAKDYKAAARIADEINWRKVKSVATLCMIGELYEKTKQLEESREIFLMAYDRSPVGRNIVYRLTHVAIKMGMLEEAQEYYEEFIEIAPHDNAKYILRYEIAKAKNASLQEQISILEEFKEREYTEEWAFELAYLYHKSGNVEKCVDICDELILWFGEGKYVEKALELKMLYQPLNKLQEDKYRRFKQKQEGIVEVSPYDELQSGEIVRETVTIPSIQPDAARFNTMNLQEELAKSMQQIMNATKQETVNDTMDNIKKLVEEAKTIDMAEVTEAAKTIDMTAVTEAAKMAVMADATEEIPKEEAIPEAALDINFKEIYDDQISLHVPEAPKPNLQITGQMSIEDILAEWERIQENTRNAIAEAEQRKLESAKEKALQEAEDIMERLSDVIPTGMQIGEMVQEELRPVVEEDIQRKAAYAAEESVREEPAAEESVQEEPAAEESVPEEPESVPEVDIEQEIMRQQALVQQALEQQIREEQILQQEVTLEKAAVEENPITELSQEQKEIFTYFTLIDGMEKQICQALEGVKQRKKDSQTSVSGNLIIIGGKGSGKTVLATDFVKAYQHLSEKDAGKVGKISGSVLNQKDIEKLFAAVKGGYLIIEKAGDLSKESVARLSGLMEQDTKGLLVIMEDDQDGIEKVLGRNTEFTKKFTEQLRVPIFTSDELVAFAKAYAKEHSCEIEEMGVLALYNSISNIQKLDEATTLTEVQEIMDEAIYRANRGGLKKLFGGKRTTEDGFVLIREKDFDE